LSISLPNVLFADCYEPETRATIRSYWHNDPIRPELSCMLKVKRLDIRNCASLCSGRRSDGDSLVEILREKTRTTYHTLKDETRGRAVYCDR